MYDHIRPPFFDSAFSNFQIPQKKWDKFITDLCNNPRHAKNAHFLNNEPFKGRALWSAHLNLAGGALYIVTYLICDGKNSSCFIKEEEGEIKNNCCRIKRCEVSKNQIVLFYIGRGHNEAYRSLRKFFT